MVDFEELKKGPRGYERHTFVAQIFPDKNLVVDMINNRKNYWVEIEAGEYEKILSEIISRR